MPKRVGAHKQMRLHTGDHGTRDVVPIVVHKEAFGGLESIAVTEQLVDTGIGLHEPLVDRDHPTIHDVPAWYARVGPLEAQARIGEQVDSKARRMDALRKPVGAGDRGLVEVPLRKGPMQVGVQPLGQPSRRHALHGPLVYGAGIEQGPAGMCKEGGVQEPGVPLVVGKGAREHHAIEAQKHLPHVKHHIFDGHASLPPAG